MISTALTSGRDSYCQMTIIKNCFGGTIRLRKNTFECDFIMHFSHCGWLHTTERCRFTWVLSDHDRVLLQNKSHVSIQRSFWGASGLGGQTFHWGDVCSWENTGAPTVGTHTHAHKNKISFRSNQ